MTVYVPPKQKIKLRKVKPRPLWPISLEPLSRKEREEMREEASEQFGPEFPSPLLLALRAALAKKGG